MAEGKKGFIVYADLIHVVRKMEKEDAGELLLHMLEYVNDLNPVTENVVVDLIFEPIKQQMKRDLKKWEGAQNQRVEAARISAERRKALFEERKQTSTTVERPLNDREQTSTVIGTGTVTGNVNGTVTVKEKKIKQSKDCFYKNIFLTSDEFQRLKNEFPEDSEDAIKFLSDYKTEKGYKTRDDNLTIRRWVIAAVQEKKSKEKSSGKKESELKPKTLD